MALPRLVVAVFFQLVVFAQADVPDPWIVTGAEVVTEAISVGNVIVAESGSLTVLGVPDPGFRVMGNLWVINNGVVRFESSVIRFLSTYHGEYTLVGTDSASIEVEDCDYRIPSGVQHGLVVSGQARLVVSNTEFGDVQLVAGEQAHLAANRLNGNFEVIIQEDASATLSDIPSEPDHGKLWVWVEFPSGSHAEYSPPLPGFVDSWSFPPPGATGIFQNITMERCETLLWPMLVRPGSDLVLRDIAAENWVVVGFFLPNPQRIVNLTNGETYTDTILDLTDRSIRLRNASIDTWNLYPQREAHIVVISSVVGEVLSFDDSTTDLFDTTVDGSGGFFGARGTSEINAVNSHFTCTIESAQSSTITLRNSVAAPYPLDPTGDWTRFGAYDDGRLLADNTVVQTTPTLGGRGLIGVTYVANPPAAPPTASAPVVLQGTAAIFSLDDGPALGSWQLQATTSGRAPTTIGQGEDNLEDGVLGVWHSADAGTNYRLLLTLTDRDGRTLTGGPVIPADIDPARLPEGRGGS